MVLVARDFRRRGLASRLMRRCIDDLVAGRRVSRCSTRHPTAGRSIARSASRTPGAFTASPCANVGRLPLPDAPPTGIAIAPIDDTVWPRLRDYDAAAFGADRGALLARLRGRLPASRTVRNARRPDRRASSWDATAGPARNSGRWSPTTMRLRVPCWRAPSHAVAGPLYVDIADAHPAIRAWLEARGFTTQRPLTRMVYRRATGFDDPARTYAVVGPEFG